MNKNSLVPNNGLSLSQAQSISNLCHQRATHIAETLSAVNNYKKTVKINGEDKVIVSAKQMPKNVTELLMEKSKLHACQAFLMENIKAKDHMLRMAKVESADTSVVEYPQHPESVNLSGSMLNEVFEEWGWEQLSVAEMNEFMEAEAFAAHIGQFIHRGGILSRLREELPNLPELEWMTIKEGEKTPVDIKKHHNSDDLLKTHEDLAEIHRAYEQRVNYFKAKVKNLVTEENARIAKHNADLQIEAERENSRRMREFKLQMDEADEKMKTIKEEFEKTRHAKIAEIASMRIKVDARFQSVIDMFLKKLPNTEE